MVSKKAQKLIDELNKLWKDNGNKWSDAYENRLMSLTEEEAELLTTSYFESEDAVFHWNNVKSCY